MTSNGCEQDVTSDSANCGACGSVCGGGSTCVGSVCVTCAIELTFTDPTIHSVGGHEGLDWGDIDMDGDEDVAVPFDGAPALVYANTGGTSLSPIWTESGSGACGVVRWGQLTSDAYPDLAVGHCDGSGGGFAHVFTNTAGTLDATATWSTAAGLWVTSLAFGDADGDGNTDMFVGTLPNLGPTSAIYRGDGSTLGAAPWWTDASRYRAGPAAILDVDGDGDGDLLLYAGEAVGPTGPEGLYFMRNDAGSYSTAWSDTSGTVPRAWALGDVDGDGDEDAVVMTSGTTLTLYRNDGAMLAAMGTPMGSTTGLRVLSLSLGDVDGDGDMDLAMARVGAADAVWLNDGAGAFTPGWNASEVEDHDQARFIDWDGDGARDDLAVNGPSAPLRVYQWVCR